MKTPKYICSKCRQPFTRRWNANRHCNNKHYGGIENIISFTEYIMNQKDSIPLTGNSKDNSSYQSNVNNNLFFDNSIFGDNLRYTTFTDPIVDAFDRELLPYEIFEQLGPTYEEMRRILDYVPEDSKKKILGNALSSAINSNHPVDTMNKELIDLRKSASSIMMLNDLASFYGRDKAYIKELLKLKFRQKE
jgi:hypothetical protein